MCERSPYTLLFYQRESRETNFTQITEAKKVKDIKEAFFMPNLMGLRFASDTNEVLITGSMVHWDTLKLKTVEKLGSEIDSMYHEHKE